MNEILSFEDEAQAYAEIEAMGYHAMAFDFPAEGKRACTGMTLIQCCT